MMVLSAQIERTWDGRLSAPNKCKCASVVADLTMSKQETVLARKRRGPAPTGKGHTVGVRMQPSELAALDAYIAKQPDDPSRPEAIRRVLAEKKVRSQRRAL